MSCISLCLCFVFYQCTWPPFTVFLSFQLVHICILLAPVSLTTVILSRKQHLQLQLHVPLHPLPPGACPEPTAEHDDNTRLLGTSASNTSSR